MGCYGIGVTRTLAAVVEQHHDENGIIWPVSVVLYEVIITLVKPKDEQQAETAEQLYGIFREKGIDVLLDDRDERPGVKFKDADLLGIPVRITVGRGVVDGLVEHKLRKETEKTEIPVREALEKTIEFILEERGKI